MPYGFSEMPRPAPPSREERSHPFDMVNEDGVKSLREQLLKTVGAEFPRIYLNENGQKLSNNLKEAIYSPQYSLDGHYMPDTILRMQKEFPTNVHLGDVQLFDVSNYVKAKFPGVIWDIGAEYILTYDSGMVAISCLEEGTLENVGKVKTEYAQAA